MDTDCEGRDTYLLFRCCSVPCMDTASFMYGAFFLGAGILAQSSARLSCVHLCAPPRPSPHISSLLAPFSSGPFKAHSAPLPPSDAPVDAIVDVIGDAIAEALESWLGGL